MPLLEVVIAGTRSVQALKPVLSCLRMVAGYEAVNIPFRQQFFDRVTERIRG